MEMLFSEKRLKVFFCDNDSHNGTMIKEYLRLKNCDISFYTDAVTGYYSILKSYDVDSCSDVGNFRKVLRKKRFDLVILDLQTLKEQGEDTLYKFKEAVEEEVPFLFFIDSDSLKIDNLGTAFRPGIDDFMVKPINLIDIAFRVHFVIDRNRKRLDSKEEKQKVLKESVYEFKNILFDYSKRKLCISGEEIKLTTKECEVLAIFCINMNKIVYRKDILKDIWHNENDRRSMDAIIYRLRKMLAPTLKIINIHGRGFKMLWTED